MTVNVELFAVFNPRVKIMMGSTGRTKAVLIQLLVVFLTVTLTLQDVQPWDTWPGFEFLDFRFRSEVPSSCTQSWPGVKYFKDYVSVGRSCAVVRIPGYSDYGTYENNCTEDVCRNACSIQYSTDLAQHFVTGNIAGAINIYGYGSLTKTGVVNSRSLISATSWLITAAAYSPPWTYTPRPPCCGGCALNGGTVQMFVWPQSMNTNHSTYALAARHNAEVATPVLNKTDSVTSTLISNGYTL